MEALQREGESIQYSRQGGALTILLHASAENNVAFIRNRLQPFMELPSVQMLCFLQACAHGAHNVAKFLAGRLAPQDRRTVADPALSLARESGHADVAAWLEREFIPSALHAPQLGCPPV
jgi:hypothetical protein